jgi:hypothetical protein
MEVITHSGPIVVVADSEEAASERLPAEGDYEFKYLAQRTADLFVEVKPAED